MAELLGGHKVTNQTNKNKILIFCMSLGTSRCQLLLSVVVAVRCYQFSIQPPDTTTALHFVRCLVVSICAVRTQIYRVIKGVFECLYIHIYFIHYTSMNFVAIFTRLTTMGQRGSLVTMLCLNPSPTRGISLNIPG